MSGFAKTNNLASRLKLSKTDITMRHYRPDQDIYVSDTEEILCCSTSHSVYFFGHGQHASLNQCIRRSLRILQHRPPTNPATTPQDFCGNKKAWVKRYFQVPCVASSNNHYTQPSHVENDVCIPICSFTPAIAHKPCYEVSICTHRHRTSELFIRVCETPHSGNWDLCKLAPKSLTNLQAFIDPKGKSAMKLIVFIHRTRYAWFTGQSYTQPR